MKQQKPELESTSLDRLKILEDRVLLSVNDYKTLLKSLAKAFKYNNTDLITNLLLQESEIVKTLTQRIKIYDAHPKTFNLPHGDVNKILIELNSEIEQFKLKLEVDKVKLEKEISQVKRIVKPFGKSREYTARRIDITT